MLFRSAITVAQDRAGTWMSIPATALAQPGDVILVAAGGDESRASWGGALSRSAKIVGAAGAAIDGKVLDTRSLLTRDLPVFCRGSTLTHDGGNSVGSVNVPVVFGGVAVSPGDYVLGDLDGLVIVPQADLPEILVASEEKTAQLAELAAQMEHDRLTLFDLYGRHGQSKRVAVEWIEGAYQQA